MPRIVTNTATTTLNTRDSSSAGSSSSSVYSSKRSSASSTAARRSPTLDNGPASSPVSPSSGRRSNSLAPAPLPPPRSTDRERSNAPLAMNALSPVDEQGNSPMRPRVAPPSAFRRQAGSTTPGKARANPEQNTPSLVVNSRPGRSPWVVDPLEAQRGVDIWSQGDRVILVLGEVTRSALSPLLYSQTFQDTLILVGSLQPLPEIDALASPSQLLNLDDTRTIYPTIQPFQPSAAAIDKSNPLLALLHEACQIADTHRKSDGLPTPRPTSWGSRSRRDSSASSSGTLTPPLTPPTVTTRSKLIPTAFGRRASATSSPSRSPAGSTPGSSTDLTRLASINGTPRRAPSVVSMNTATNANERQTSARRMKSFIFGDEPRVSEGSPFDAVINFIPTPTVRTDQQRTLQEMLQHTVILSTAVLPILTTAITPNSVTASTPANELAPISMINIVPTTAPLTFAPVVERFLLPLLPTMGQRVRRNLFGCVTGHGAWMAQDTAPGPDSLPGADTLICGGVRNMFVGNEGGAPQALLPGWDHCINMPGALTDAAQNKVAPPSFSKRASSYTLSELRAAQAGHPLPAPSSPGDMHPRPELSSAGRSIARKFSISSIRDFTPGSGSGTKSRSATLPIAKSASMNKVGGRTADPSAAAPTIAKQPVITPLASVAPVAPVLPAKDNNTPTLTAAKAISPSAPPFTSQFDPRMRNPSANASEASTLPPGAARPRLPSMGFGRDKSRKESAPNSNNQLVPSPPTPELDPSSSSCSSSSVLEPPPDEPTVHATPVRAASAPTENVKPQSGVISRKYTFSSLFKRRGIRA